MSFSTILNQCGFIYRILNGEIMSVTRSFVYTRRYILTVSGDGGRGPLTSTSGIFHRSIFMTPLLCARQLEQYHESSSSRVSSLVQASKHCSRVSPECTDCTDKANDKAVRGLQKYAEVCMPLYRRPSETMSWVSPRDDIFLYPGFAVIVVPNKTNAILRYRGAPCFFGGGSVT